VKCTWVEALTPGLKQIFYDSYGTYPQYFSVESDVDFMGIKVRAMDHDVWVQQRIYRELIEDDQYCVISEMVRNMAKQLKYHNEVKMPIREIMDEFEELNIPTEEIKCLLSQ
jgi:hypothetical protein